MKTWFDKNRIKMFNKACHGMLRNEICEGLSIKEMENVLRTLESFNKGKLAQNGGVKVESHDVDLGSEIAQAISAEVVWVEDDKFISELRNNATNTKVINLDNAKKPSYIGDRLSLIGDAIKEIYKVLDTGKPFILCAPLEISLLQSSHKSKYCCADDDAFNGPNYSKLVGNLDKTPIYSYIPDIQDTEDGDAEFIVGVYYEKEDRCCTHTLVVKNISFT